MWATSPNPNPRPLTLTLTLTLNPNLLEVGNQLNARTHRGNARGFELSTLKELATGTKHGTRPTLTVTLTLTGTLTLNPILTLTLTLTLSPQP